MRVVVEAIVSPFFPGCVQVECCVYLDRKAFRNVRYYPLSAWAELNSTRSFWETLAEIWYLRFAQAADIGRSALLRELIRRQVWKAAVGCRPGTGGRGVSRRNARQVTGKPKFVPGAASTAGDLHRLVCVKVWIDNNAPQEVRDDFHAVYGAVRKALGGKR